VFIADVAADRVVVALDLELKVTNLRRGGQGEVSLARLCLQRDGDNPGSRPLASL
jgi:hypothetical protein